MGIWLGVTVEATTKNNAHVSVVKIVEDVSDGHDFVFSEKQSQLYEAWTRHIVEYRIELDGHPTIIYLNKLNKALTEKCVEHTITADNLVLY